jgi:hypothetical protein
MEDAEQIIDTRFQSFMRLYIHDLLNANLDHHNSVTNENGDEQSNAPNNFNSGNRRGLVRVNNLHFYKVSICGMIVGIFENSKFYRLKIDDSTGCIGVTLWKSSMFNENSLEFCSNNRSSSSQQGDFGELYQILSSIQSRIKEKHVNNCIMYEPKQGDLVVIRGQVKCYRQRIELNAVSCARVQNATEELVHMMLPSVLAEKSYSIDSMSVQEYEQKTSDVNKSEFECKNVLTAQESNKPSNNQPKSNEFTSIKNKEAFMSFVNKKLVELTTGNGLNNTKNVTMSITNTTYNENNGQSCDSYSLFSFLRNNCPIEFKFVSHKQVLGALKELEMRGLVYSCEDEFHYLPIS